MRRRATIDNLYDEMLIMRDQLLNRIELLESDVDILTQENMDYAKQMYNLENYLEDRIDTMLEHITNLNNSEGSRSSKKTNQTIKETS
jgi:hypothetical protein